jgi:ribonuclease HII
MIQNKEILTIDDSSSDEEYVLTNTKTKKTKKSEIKKSEIKKSETKKLECKKEKSLTMNVLKGYHNSDDKIIEIGVDEAGRGPLFGRVYTAAVILPKDNSFDFSKVKDSKKFHSKKKIEEAADYIKQNALAWHVSYEDEKKIDEINILQATQLSMHNSIHETRKKYNMLSKQKNKFEKLDFNYSLLIDGNYFNPITSFNKETNKIETIPYMTVEGGDNKYASIAAASILAKVERDNYIDELCSNNPELSEFYGIDSNKGYGAKRHLDGIKEHGITIWHRRSFAPCKNYV